MQSTSLTELADELVRQAKESKAGRASRTVHGGREHALRQTMIALAAGEQLHEHESPDEATVQVLRGRVRLSTGSDSVELAERDFLVVPPERHAVEAADDAVLLLTTSMHGIG